MFTKDQLQQMFLLQHTCNKITAGEHYLAAFHPFDLASQIEANEIFDHVPWKWWKKGVTNFAQAQIELIDIWHFIMSEMLSQSYSELLQKKTVFTEQEVLEDAINTAFHDFGLIKKEFENMDLHSLIREFIRDNIDNSQQGIQHCSDLTIFAQMCNRLELSADDLYFQYVFKNTLNIFRQHNGYKTGEYVKNKWPANFMDDPEKGESEDNVFLESLMGSYRLTNKVPTFESITENLTRVYSQISK